MVMVAGLFRAAALAAGLGWLATVSFSALSFSYARTTFQQAVSSRFHNLGERLRATRNVFTRKATGQQAEEYDEVLHAPLLFEGVLSPASASDAEFQQASTDAGAGGYVPIILQDATGDFPLSNPGLGDGGMETQAPATQALGSKKIGVAGRKKKATYSGRGSSAKDRPPKNERSSAEKNGPSADADGLKSQKSEMDTTTSAAAAAAVAAASFPGVLSDVDDGGNGVVVEEEEEGGNVSNAPDVSLGHYMRQRVGKKEDVAERLQPSENRAEFAASAVVHDAKLEPEQRAQPDLDNKGNKAESSSNRRATVARDPPSVPSGTERTSDIPTDIAEGEPRGAAPFTAAAVVDDSGSPSQSASAAASVEQATIEVSSWTEPASSAGEGQPVRPDIGPSCDSDAFAPHDKVDDGSRLGSATPGSPMTPATSSDATGSNGDTRRSSSSSAAGNSGRASIGDAVVHVASPREADGQPRTLDNMPSDPVGTSEHPEESAGLHCVLDEPTAGIATEPPPTASSAQTAISDPRPPEMTAVCSVSAATATAQDGRRAPTASPGRSPSSIEAEAANLVAISKTPADSEPSPTPPSEGPTVEPMELLLALWVMNVFAGICAWQIRDRFLAWMQDTRLALVALFARGFRRRVRQANRGRAAAPDVSYSPVGSLFSPAVSKEDLISLVEEVLTVSVVDPSQVQYVVNATSLDRVDLKTFYWLNDGFASTKATTLLSQRSMIYHGPRGSPRFISARGVFALLTSVCSKSRADDSIVLCLSRQQQGTHEPQDRVFTGRLLAIDPMDVNLNGYSTSLHVVIFEDESCEGTGRPAVEADEINGAGARVLTYSDWVGVYGECRDAVLTAWVHRGDGEGLEN